MAELANAIIPKTVTEIDPAWLNEVLSEEVRGGGDVIGVDIEVIGEGVGFMGEVARLSLTYLGGVNSTTSMIAKVPTLVEGPRFMGQLLGLYEKEHSFYRDVAPEIRIRIPACYVNLANAETTDYILLLEDLSPMRPGDQLASCTRDEASAALSALAKLHARWWDHPRLDDFASWLPAHGDPYFDLVKGALVDAIDAFLDMWGDAVPEEIVRTLLEDKESFEAYDRRTAQTIGRAPRTFLHGDFRLDNMMFNDADDGDPVAIIDWQVGLCANPMIDVIYFLAGNFSPEFRRKNERELVEEYHQAVVDAGVTDYPIEQCWNDYRISAVVLLAYVVIAAGSFDLDEVNDRGRELFEVMFDRYTKAITELDSLSLITE